MTVKLCWNNYRGAFLGGLNNDFAKYERDIISGKIPCPFTVEFRDKDGNVICTKPIPLTPDGKPKIDLFG